MLFKHVYLRSFYVRAVRGWVPPRQRADLIWNRTVNVKGGAGECLAMDLVNEHCNQDFKGNKDFYLKMVVIDTLW